MEDIDYQDIAYQNMLYEEKVRSRWTSALFIFLTCFFFITCIWNMTAVGPFALTLIPLLLALTFLFYTFNYVTLIIRITAKHIQLIFGVFRWSLPIDNVGSCQLDDIPAFMRYGGAGIHFMMVRKRYRASYNFLEHPRVVIELKKKAGPVQDVSFTTRHPDAVLRTLERLIQ
jgi:hypothetical protein